MSLFGPPPSDDARPRDGAGDPAPLADRMRPSRLDELAGQEHLVGPGRPLRLLAGGGRLPSMILWGAPGTGKTTLATILATDTSAHFVTFSAVLAGVADVRRVVDEARVRAHDGVPTVLFVDEIHRFNKKQQDAFLPHVERGLLTLIGATTENPSFEVIGALLSRCRIYTLRLLADEAVAEVLERARTDRERGLGARPVELDDAARSLILSVANGDARAALNVLETSAFAAGWRPPDDPGEGRDTRSGPPGDRSREDRAGADPGGEPAPVVRVTAALVRDVCQSGRALPMDRGGEEHYTLASAFQKSIRGSDPDAALYWLARMLEAGEDPLFVARRLVRTASEDVGNADPQALALAVAAKDAAHFVGMPEATAALAQATVYLATAPKSNASAAGYEAAARDARETRADPVPLHIRNAPTRLMKSLGYGAGYAYDHDEPEGFSGQAFLPEGLRGRSYYRPVSRGFEREIQRRMAYGERRRAGRTGGVAEGGAPRGGGSGDPAPDPKDEG